MQDDPSVRRKMSSGKTVSLVELETILKAPAGYYRTVDRGADGLYAVPPPWYSRWTWGFFWRLLAVRWFRT